MSCNSVLQLSDQPFKRPNHKSVSNYLNFHKLPKTTRQRLRKSC